MAVYVSHIGERTKDGLGLSSGFKNRCSAEVIRLGNTPIRGVQKLS